MAVKKPTKAQAEMMMKFEEGVPLSDIAESFGLGVDECCKRLKGLFSEILPETDRVGKHARSILDIVARLEAECAKAIQRAKNREDKKHFTSIANRARKMRAGPISQIAQEQARRLGVAK